MASRARYRKIISSGPVVISSSSGTLRGPEGACEPDLSGSVLGGSATAVQSVGSRVRLLGPSRVAVSSSDIFLPRSGWSGVAFELRRRGHRRRAMVSGASVPRRQQGCDSRVSDRPFPTSESSRIRSAPVRQSRRCFFDRSRGGVVFGPRKRGARALSTPAERSRPASSWSRPAGTCGRSPSPAQKRTGRANPVTAADARRNFRV